MARINDWRDKLTSVQQGNTTTTHLTTTDDLLLLAYAAPTDTHPEASSAYGLTTLFQGRAWHGELGMYYYRNRWYLPEMGVFGERDPEEISGLPALYCAFGNAPNEVTDPFGEWDFDLSGLTDSANFLDSIEDIKKKARVLLLTEPTKRYLRFRFGPSVNDLYLRRVARDGTPPRVVFDAVEVEVSGGFAFYRNGTIYLKPYFAQAESRAANIVNWEHPSTAARLMEAVQWSMAVTLVHETIHFIDHDIDGKEAIDAHTIGYDIGDKWEYFLFGAYGGGWGPPHYIDRTNASEFLRFLGWVEVVRSPELQEKNARELERRLLRIQCFLDRQRNQAGPRATGDSGK